MRCSRRLHTACEVPRSACLSTWLRSSFPAPPVPVLAGGRAVVAPQRGNGGGWGGADPGSTIAPLQETREVMPVSAIRPGGRAPFPVPGGYRKGALLADWLSSTDHKVIG